MNKPELDFDRTAIAWLFAEMRKLGVAAFECGGVKVAMGPDPAPRIEPDGYQEDEDHTFDHTGIRPPDLRHARAGFIGRMEGQQQETDR